MFVKINGNEIPKEELAVYLERNKLAAIVFLRTNTGIGLKDAKDIVDNLAANIDHYDTIHIQTKTVRSFKTLDDQTTKNTRPLSFQRQSEKGSHFLPTNSSRKLYVYIALLVLVIALYYVWF